MTAPEKDTVGVSRPMATFLLGQVCRGHMAVYRANFEFVADNAGPYVRQVSGGQTKFFRTGLSWSNGGLKGHV